MDQLGWMKLDETLRSITHLVLMCVVQSNWGNHQKWHFVHSLKPGPDSFQSKLGTELVYHVNPECLRLPGRLAV